MLFCTPESPSPPQGALNDETIPPASGENICARKVEALSPAAYPGHRLFGGACCNEYIQFTTADDKHCAGKRYRPRRAAAHRRGAGLLAGRVGKRAVDVIAEEHGRLRQGCPQAWS